MQTFIALPGALDPQFPPPYAFTGLHVRGVEFAADLGALQALCDVFLNIGDSERRGFVYRPLTSFVALEINLYDHMSCANPIYDGYTTQQEVYVRIPVAKHPLIFGVPALVPVEIANFFPFIFVDNPWSAFTGREVVGLGKQLGRINQAKTADGSFAGELTLPVLQTLSPSTPQTDAQVVRVQSGVPLAGGAAPGLAWPWIGLALDPFSALEAALINEVMALGLIDPTALSTIQLKQFRDAAAPNLACYQALVGGSYALSNVTAPTLYAGGTVTFTDFPTMSMAAQLGLPAGSPVACPVAYSVSCDMTYGSVRNVFVA